MEVVGLREMIKYVLETAMDRSTAGATTTTAAATKLGLLSFSIARSRLINLHRGGAHRRRGRRRSRHTARSASGSANVSASRGTLHSLIVRQKATAGERTATDVFCTHHAHHGTRKKAVEDKHVRPERAASALGHRRSNRRRRLS